MKINRYQAGARASRRWTDRRLNRLGRAWRRRNAAAPYQVGYIWPMGPWGGQVDVIIGRGLSWEEAFAAADRTEQTAR